MAFSTETGGVNFAVATPNLAQFSALSELKPLSFAGGMQSPLEFRTMAAIRPPDAQPELVAQGIGKAMGSVAEGITAFYKSKTDERKDQLKYQRDLQIAKVKSDKDEARYNEMERHNRAMEANTADRIEKVGGNKGKSLSARSLGGTQAPSEPSSPEPESPREPVRFFGKDPETNYLRATEPVKAVPQKLSYDAVDQQSQALADLGDIFSPTQISYVSASNAPVGAMADVPSAVPSIPTNPTADSTQVVKVDPNTGEPITLGQLSATTFGNISPVLGAFEGGDANDIYGYQSPQEAPADSPALSDVKPVGNPVMENAIGIDAIYSEQEALALRDYAVKTGRMAPSIKATNDGYEVNWPEPMALESMANRKDAARQKKEDASAGKKPEEIFKEEKELRNEFIDQAKNFKVLQSAWTNLKGKLENPTGASDMSLIFAYMKLLDPTSTIREGEYATARDVGTIPQTFIGKYNKAIDGKGFLAPPVRESFINEARAMFNSSLKDHKQSKETYSKLAKANNLNPDNVVLDLVSKDQAEGEMEALRQELSAVADQDRATYPNFNAKKERYKALKKAQDQQASSGQAKPTSTQTPSTPQKSNAQNQGIFSNYFKAPPIF